MDQLEKSCFSFFDSCLFVFFHDYFLQILRTVTANSHESTKEPKLNHSKPGALDISSDEPIELKVRAGRGARVVESGSLENCCTFTGTVGSNPTLSATCGHGFQDSKFQIPQIEKGKIIIWNLKSGI